MTYFEKVMNCFILWSVNNNNNDSREVPKPTTDMSRPVKNEVQKVRETITVPDFSRHSYRLECTDRPLRSTFDSRVFSHN